MYSYLVSNSDNYIFSKTEISKNSYIKNVCRTVISVNGKNMYMFPKNYQQLQIQVGLSVSNLFTLDNST